MVSSQAVALAIQIASTVALARLLAPRDFGLLAIVTTYILLFSNFGLNGFTEAIIQGERIEHFLASNLFWINLGVGSLLSFTFVAAGPLLAWFFHDNRVARVAVVTSSAIFVTSTSVLHLALLKRAMRFAAVSANDIVARGVSVLTSILLAWAGWGYWALVAGMFMLSLSTSVGAWLLCRWVPSFPRRVPGTASMVKFALHVYGRFTVNYFARNMDNVLVGWRFNVQALGFYKKAYDLFALSAMQLISPLTTVAVATLSPLKQDPVQYRRYLLNALGVMAFVGMGLSADLTLVGKDMIRLLMGPQWDEAGRIFTFFGPGIGIMLLYGTHGWIHLSIGRADRWFRWSIVEFAFTGLLFILGLPWGPAGIAVAWTASFWILTIPAFWYAGRPIRLGVAPVLAAIWKYAIASLLAGCVSRAIALAARLPVVPRSALEAAEGSVVVSVLFLALYVGTVVLLHGGCAPLYRLARLLREMLPADKPPIPCSAPAP
jgi:O-antigen/teichoic acid export membrane protein